MPVSTGDHSREDSLRERVIPAGHASAWGDIFEFGVWWGANVSLFANLRTVYEPYNRVRKVVGFDTYTGYPDIGSEDRASEHMSAGLYSVSHDYRQHLEAVLNAHER
jgi:hypothetical protein